MANSLCFTQNVHSRGMCIKETKFSWTTKCENLRTNLKFALKIIFLSAGQSWYNLLLTGVQSNLMDSPAFSWGRWIARREEVSRGQMLHLFCSLCFYFVQHVCNQPFLLPSFGTYLRGCGWSVYTCKVRDQKIRCNHISGEKKVHGIQYIKWEGEEGINGERNEKKKLIECFFWSIENRKKVSGWKDGDVENIIISIPSSPFMAWKSEHEEEKKMKMEKGSCYFCTFQLY